MGHADFEPYHACCDEGDGAAGHCAGERHRWTPYQQRSCHFHGARHVGDPDLVLEGDFMPPSGRACASKLFELPVEKRPTAIFAATDQMAYGVLAAAEEYGLSVPVDVALVGFDDDVPSAHVRPALTTIRQPNLEMGQQGIKLLLSILEAPGFPESSKWTSAIVEGMSGGINGGTRLVEAQPRRIQLPTSLVVRASCGADFHISVSTSSDKEVT